MNVACYLSDPPKGFETYKSMVVGLNTCRLAHSLGENPIIREDWIKVFWDNASAKKGDRVIKSKVQNKDVSVTEQDIREVLLFGDDASDPVEYTKEKLLHRYWRFLAHVYLVCISGNKSGIDKLTLRQTSGVMSLIKGWKYNYSKSVFDDMLANVKTINDIKWYKFSKFLQLILETKYPKLPITVKTYDVKLMNHMINATVADEHDVEIIETPVGTNEPVENVDLTRIESEEDKADDEMADDDDEVNENVSEGETETEVNTKSLTTETENVEEPVNVNPPHVELVTTTATADDEDVQEDPTNDLLPRKRSKRDPRISGQDNTEVRTTTEITLPVTTTQTPIHYTPSELNTKIIDFIQNEKVTMYMPAPRPVEAAAKSKEEETREAVDSSDSDDLFEENETAIVIRRITVLEKDMIFKDAQIASLMEELVVKNHKIHELETNLGEEQKEHEDAIDRYIANPPRTANQKTRKKITVMRNVGAERDLQFSDRPDRYGITTEKDKHFIVKRKNGDVEYYYNSAAFESWTVVDLRELSNEEYHDHCKNPNCKIGFNFFNRLQQQARVNFKDMKLA
ncbi:hypothetical protein Hanom_Chr05g00426071 [Helianthus anomalus]